MSRKAFFTVAAVIASGTLVYFGTGLHPVWYLTWLAAIPVLVFAARASWKSSFLAAFAAWLAGNSNEFGYAHNVVGIPLLPVTMILAVPAVAFALAVLSWRFCVRRGSQWSAALAFPSAWIAFEFLNASTSPHGTFGSLAYTQMDCLPVLQLASLAGVWAVAFVPFFASAAVAIAISGCAALRSRAAIGFSAALAITAVVAYGEWRLHADMHATGQLRVALISSGAERDHWAKDDTQALEILHRYAQQIEQVRDAQVMVLPEDLGPVTPAVVPAATELFSAAARRSAAEIVVGLRAGRKPPILNEALVFAPSGKLEASYEKHHLIPGLEAGIVAGRDIVTLTQSTGVEGVQICKDLDFPHLSRKYGNRGVGLLLVPAFDFDVDGWLHGRMAVMRGVESGFSIARAARRGLLTVTDNRGRVLADGPGTPSGFTVVESQVPVAHADTLYDRWADWFAWAALIALCLALARSWPHNS